MAKGRPRESTARRYMLGVRLNSDDQEVLAELKRRAPRGAKDNASVTRWALRYLRMALRREGELAPTVGAVPQGAGDGQG